MFSFKTHIHRIIESFSAIVILNNSVWHGLKWMGANTHTKVNKETNWLPCVQECAWDSHCHRSNKVRALNTRELIWNVQLFNFRRLSEWKEIDLKRWKYEFKGIQIKLQRARLLKDSQNVSVWFETANEHLLR